MPMAKTHEMIDIINDAYSCSINTTVQFPDLAGTHM